MHRPPDHSTAERDAPHRRAPIDALVRLIVALAAIGAVLLSTRPVLPLAVLGVALAALIAERRSWRALVGQFAAPLGLAAVVGLARVLTTGRTPLVTCDLGPLHLVATREGAVEGLRIGLRVLASVAATLAVCRSVPAAELFSALQWMRLPRAWLEIAMLMHRYIYVFRAQAENVMAAQRVRLGYAGWRTSVRSLGSLAGVVVLRCLVQTQRTYDAMQVRAYRGTWPLVAPPALGRRDQLAIAVAVGLLVAAYLLLEKGHAMSQPMRPPALEARQVQFAYPDGVQALAGLSFRANPGELLVVLGANGSGKTTLLKVLARLLTPQAGQVWLGEDPLGTLAAATLYSQVGLVFQNPADQLFADSVAEDVAFGPRNLGLDAAEVTARVCAALRDVDAWPLHERPVHQLSFGQQKRVCLACALAMQPQILLLDEPTGGLDPAGEEQMLELLLRLNREQGVTVVVSTHAVDRLPALADRVYVLRAGQVSREGPAGDVFADRQAILEAGLRRPLIAELFEASCVGASPAGQPLPLTVEEGRRQLVRWITQRQGDPR